jgi:hypothetical protein
VSQHDTAKPLGLALWLDQMNRLLIGSADKTNYLLELLRNETAVLVIDPRGDLARAAANQLPARLTQRALYFDPADIAHPVGLNVLQNVPPPDRQLLTEQLCAWYDAMFPEGEATLSKRHARFLFANCIRLLLDNNETMLGILKLLTENSFRQKCLSAITDDAKADPAVLKNWQVLKGKQYESAFALLHSQLGTLFMAPMVRNIIGQPKTTLKADIVIANLDRGKLGDTTARLLGGLLLVHSQGPVVVNDYGFFATPVPLPQGRFTLAVNFLDELPPRLRQEVLGIDDKTVFKTNKRDAEELAFYVGALNPRKLVELDPGEAVNTYQGDIEPERPANLKRLKPLKKRTRACHTVPRAKVERAIRKYLN